MATKKFSDYAIQGNNVTLTYDNVNDTVTFDVNIDKNDVGLGNVDNTSDVNKPISTATQTALDGKASTTSLNAHTSDLNNPHAVTKSQVGLSNVDNTSDANKPISSATQTALDGKQDSLGFTPVTNARTLTINGTTFDLSANRTWSVGDLVSSGSYSNPSWLTSLAWGKLTGTPTTLSGYGITDAVPSSRTLTINGTAYDLSADRSWTISTATPTLAQVTTAGNTTTNAISVGGLTSNGAAYFKNEINGLWGIGELTFNRGSSFNTPTLGVGNTDASGKFASLIAGTSGAAFIFDASGFFTIGNDTKANYTNRVLGSATVPNIRIWGSTGNVAINTTTDAGYKLDVNGTVRFGQSLTSNTNNPQFIWSQGAFAIQYNASPVMRFMYNGYVKVLTSLNITDNVNNSTSAALGVNSTITAATSIAQGVYFNNTLVAAANNDVLVGLDINPTFTNGAFTGVSNYGMRINGASATLNINSATGTVARLTTSTNYLIGPDSEITTLNGAIGNQFGIFRGGTVFGVSGYYGIQYFTSGTERMRLFQNGNFAINTTTDAGYKLDVNGTVRVSGAFTVGDIYGGYFRSTGASDTYIQLANTSGINLAVHNASINGFRFIGGATEIMRLFKSGNLVIQNGGTFTDEGYKLDVNGSTRLNGALTLGMTPIVAASIMSTHKLQITIAGTTYYLLASNI